MNHFHTNFAQEKGYYGYPLSLSMLFANPFVYTTEYDCITRFGVVPIYRSKLTTRLKCLVNSNEEFEYSTTLEPLDALPVSKHFHPKSMVTKHRRISEATETTQRGIFWKGLRYPHHIKITKVWEKLIDLLLLTTVRDRN